MAAELGAAEMRAEEAMGLAMGRAREEREAAVEQCNAHWMGMVGRQSAVAQTAAEAAMAAHAERLAVETGKVSALEEAALRQVEESSTRLREVEQATRASSLDELNAASHRHDRTLRQSVAKLEAALATGAHDHQLAQLLAAEEAGKTRKGAVRVLQARQEAAG